MTHFAFNCTVKTVSLSERLLGICTNYIFSIIACTFHPNSVCECTKHILMLISLKAHLAEVATKKEKIRFCT